MDWRCACCAASNAPAKWEKAEGGTEAGEVAGRVEAKALRSDRASRRRGYRDINGLKKEVVNVVDTYCNFAAMNCNMFSCLFCRFSRPRLYLILP